MTAELVRRRELVTQVFWEREFEWLHEPGAGFAFPCDERGVIVPRNEASLENLVRCIDGTYAVEDLGVRSRVHQHYEPAAVRCGCRAEVELWDALHNECVCGRAYNGSGQELRPVEQWSDEDRYAVFGPRRVG